MYLLVNFLFVIKLSFKFFFTKFKYLQTIRKLYSYSLSLSIALARLGTILPVVREITLIKKV